MITHDGEAVCARRAGNLYDALGIVLDRGMVTDAFVRVSPVGNEILTTDARIVAASVGTCLRYAEARSRLGPEHGVRSRTVPERSGGPVARTMGRAGAGRTARTRRRPGHEADVRPAAALALGVLRGARRAAREVLDEDAVDESAFEREEERLLALLERPARPTGRTTTTDPARRRHA
ncbi:gas vesicle protein [Streptomyces sp. AC627_RSS907]|uniref:gas vesicle protein n=1 Tax=Streptomyces sp. AC627_RSS907 TaxID=2823684 RepID=UPI0020B8B8E1|nr:gas vesicle protein [Streptomyces sp. AC627_RSS907]